MMRQVVLILAFASSYIGAFAPLVSKVGFASLREQRRTEKSPLFSTTEAPNETKNTPSSSSSTTTTQSSFKKEPPFRTIMACNRAEIAVRILRASTELNAATVAIYTHEDRYSQHRWPADRSYLLTKPEGASPISAYLDIPQIIQIAKQANVDAIHPGMCCGTVLCTEYMCVCVFDSHFLFQDTVSYPKAVHLRPPAKKMALPLLDPRWKISNDFPIKRRHEMLPLKLVCPSYRDRKPWSHEKTLCSGSNKMEDCPSLLRPPWAVEARVCGLCET